MNFVNSSQSPTFRRLVYLDWNVIILIAEGHRPAFRAALAEAKDKSDILIPFSAAHVEEADNIADQAWAPKELPEKRLQFLSKLSEDVYLYNGGNKYSPSIRRESPEDVRRTLIEVPFAKRAMHSFINIFGFDQMKQFRDLVQLSPNELNNIKPPKVIDQLDQIISKKLSGWSPQVPPGFGVRQAVEIALRLFPNADTLGIESKMAAVFMGLNIFGFWPDNRKKTSPVAALYDFMHAANGAFCHYFVTEDKALRIKAQAVYEFFEVKTNVMDIEEMMIVLKE